MAKLNSGLVLIGCLVVMAFGSTDNQGENAIVKEGKETIWRFPFSRSSDAAAIELGEVSEASKKLDTIKAMVDERKKKRKNRNKAEKDRRRSRQEPSFVSMHGDEKMQDAGKSFLEALGLVDFKKPSDSEGSAAHNPAIEDLKVRVKHQLEMDPDQIPQDLVHFEMVVGGKLVLDSPPIAVAQEREDEDAAAKENLPADGFIHYDQADWIPDEVWDDNDELDGEEHGGDRHLAETTGGGTAVISTTIVNTTSEKAVVLTKTAGTKKSSATILKSFKQDAPDMPDEDDRTQKARESSSAKLPPDKFSPKDRGRLPRR